MERNPTRAVESDTEAEGGLLSFTFIRLVLKQSPWLDIDHAYDEAESELSFLQVRVLELEFGVFCRPGQGQPSVGRPQIEYSTEFQMDLSNTVRASPLSHRALDSAYSHYFRTVIFVLMITSDTSG